MASNQTSCSNSRVGCVIKIGRDTVILNMQELEHLCCHSMYFCEHINNLTILNMSPKVTLPEEIMDRNMLMTLVGNKVLPNNVDLINFIHMCGYLMVKEKYGLHMLRSMEKLDSIRSHPKIIPVIYFVLYKLSNLDNIAYFLLWVLGFEYIPPLIKNHENYYSFRKFVRNSIRSDTRFHQMYEKFPWKFEHLVAKCPCERCWLDLSLKNIFSEISEQINEALAGGKTNHKSNRELTFHSTCPVCSKY